MTDQIVRRRVELMDIEPSIWPRVDVSLTTNLRALHEPIQAIMPWENYHLSQFTIGKRIYGEPSPEETVWSHKVYHARNMRLAALVERRITKLDYTCDFGDNRQHRIAIEHIETSNPDIDYPMYLDGERTAAPDDVGAMISWKPWQTVVTRSTRIGSAGTGDHSIR